MASATDHQAVHWAQKFPQTAGTAVGSWSKLHPDHVSVLSKWSERMESSVSSTAQDMRNQTFSALLHRNGDLAERPPTKSDIVGRMNTGQTPQSGPFQGFDDSEFYHRILQGFIKNRDVGSMGGLSVLPRDRVKRTRGDSRDRKASKGRKVQYQVHEKLAHFMMPFHGREGTWHEQQVDELFISLPHS